MRTSAGTRIAGAPGTGSGVGIGVGAGAGAGLAAGPTANTPAMWRPGPQPRGDKVFEAFPETVCLALVRGSTRSIAILDTHPPFPAGSPLRAAFLDELHKAVVRGVRVRIVVMEAAAPVMAARIGRYLRDLHMLRQRLEAAQRDRLEIRLADASPAITGYRFDDRLLISGYPRVRRAAQTPHVLVAADSPAGGLVLRRFEGLMGAGADVVDRMTCEVTVHAECGRHVFSEVPYVRRGPHLHILLADDGRGLPTGLAAARADVAWTGPAGRTSAACVVEPTGGQEWRQWLGESFHEKYGEIPMTRELLRCRLSVVG